MRAFFVVFITIDNNRASGDKDSYNDRSPDDQGSSNSEDNHNRIDNGGRNNSLRGIDIRDKPERLRPHPPQLLLALTEPAQLFLLLG